MGFCLFAVLPDSNGLARFLSSIHNAFRRVHGAFPRRLSRPASETLPVVASKFDAHYVVNSAVDQRWRCAGCWMSSDSASHLIHRKCASPQGKGHSMLALSRLVFCRTCGAFSEKGVRHLSDWCQPCKPGTPRDRSRTRMLRGYHPYSLEFLGPPQHFEPREFSWILRGLPIIQCY